MGHGVISNGRDDDKLLFELENLCAMYYIVNKDQNAIHFQVYSLSTF